jgi:hypothetical protein
MLDEYLANQAKAQELAGSLSIAQLNWRKGASWSVAECLAHMAASNRAVGTAIQDAVDRKAGGQPDTGGGFPTPGFMAQMLVRSVEPPPKFKAKAGAATRPDAPSYGKEILDTYLASHEKLLAVLQQGGAPRLSAIGFRHPALPLRLPVDAGLALSAAHDRRHLWQAEQVTRAAGFPKS